MENKITNINKAGIDLIKEFEGLRLKPYLCQSGIPTIGIGTTRYPSGIKVTLNDKSITIEQAEEYFRHDIKQFELIVDNYCRDDLNSNQFSSLCAFVYNIGQGNFKSSTLLKKLNKNPNDISIATEFSKWNKSDGKVSEGLIRRRKSESQLYFKPIV